MLELWYYTLIGVLASALTGLIFQIKEDKDAITLAKQEAGENE